MCCRIRHPGHTIGTTSWAVLILSVFALSLIRPSAWAEPACGDPQPVVAEESQPLEPIDFVDKPGWVLMKKSVIRSPDGEHHAYCLSHETRREHMLIHDGNEVWRGPTIDRLVFSPDSARLAAFSDHGGHWNLVLDNKTIRCPRPIGSPVFSPDSKHLGYWARDGKRFFLVFNTEVQPIYDAVKRDSLTFAQELGTPGYFAQKADQWLIVSGDKEYPIDGEPRGELVYDQELGRFVEHFPATTVASGESAGDKTD